MKEKFTKFYEKNWRVLVIIIALIYIGMGAVQILFNFTIDPQKSHNIEGVLMVIAMILFLNGKKKERQVNAQKKQDEE